MIRRLYRCPEIGSGTLADPRRAHIADIVIGNSVQGFTDWRNPALPVRYCWVWGPVAIHDLLDADVAVRPGSPRLQPEQVRQWLAQPASSLSSQFRAVLEDDGFDTGWVQPHHVVGNVVDYLAAQHAAMQGAYSLRRPALQRFFELDLDDTAGSLTAVDRQDLVNWLADAGLDTTLLQATNTVRQIRRWAIRGRRWPRLRLGDIVVGL